MGKRAQPTSDDDEFEGGRDSALSDYETQVKRSPKKTRKRLKSTPAASKGTEPELGEWTDRIVIPHSKRSHIISSSLPLQKALVDWYKGACEARRMPWRKPWDPNLNEDERAQRAYEVWVSEIMLQQTQVVTVIPYYNAWMEKFPTLADLAAATIDEVNALWKGLGYYSRASRLLAGAQKAVKSFNAKLPATAAELQAEIPGIGRYSAGAIASIAFGEHAPVLDGNVHRLLSRVLGLYANPKSKGTLDILWGAAEAMVERNNLHEDLRPGDINQALIELGSTVCKVKDPTCDLCPLRPFCSAYERTNAHPVSYPINQEIEDLCTICEPLPPQPSVTIYPMKAQKKKAREEVDIVSIIEWRAQKNSKDRSILMVKRPNTGLLAGLYDFPTKTDVSISDNISRIANDLLAQHIPKSTVSSLDSQDQKIGDVLHIFSHIRKTYQVHHILLISPILPPLLGVQDAQWILVDKVSATNIGTGVAKVWKLFRSKLNY